LKLMEITATQLKCYLTENTVRLHFKDQSVSALHWNGGRLLLG
jgi:hypothetical protein